MKKEAKIKEIRALFMNKLSLSILLSQDEFVNFCIKLTSFLNYSRDTILLNLNKEDIEIGLDNAINFFNK